MNHKELNTLFIFSKNNTVFIKDSEEEFWSPINFQWVPILKLKKEMKQQSI